jgi:UDP-glucose 4-epimerase
MTKCVIFGGNGFIGSHLAEDLIANGYDVSIFDTFKNGMQNIENMKDEIKLIKGDFLNDKDLSVAMDDADYVFHFISTTTPAGSITNPIHDINSNVIGSVNLFQKALEKNVKKVIFPSSGGTIYGDTFGKPVDEDAPLNPTNPYAISKLAIEKYLEFFYQTYGMDYCILRYSNPYGERQNPYGNQGVIPIFLNKIKKREKPVIYGDGSSVRDYIYIDDAIKGTLSVIKSNSKFKIFNIGSGTGTSLNELIACMSSVTKTHVSPIYNESKGIYLSKIVLDISRISRETGWIPATSLPEGISKTWSWIRERA